MSTKVLYASQCKKCKIIFHVKPFNQKFQVVEGCISITHIGCGGIVEPVLIKEGKIYEWRSG